MRLFSRLYDKVLRWSQHPHAPRYLAGLSFAESSFFPIPPDVMLAPMALATPKRAWRFALLTTIASVIGGVLGYIIGAGFFDLIEPSLRESHYWASYQRATEWFHEWGFWAIFLAGFSPVPYKIFTITAGVIGMAFLPFLLASVVGRGARFYMVAGLMRWGGEAMERRLRQYIDRIGWILVIFVIIGYVVLSNGHSG